MAKPHAPPLQNSQTYPFCPHLLSSLRNLLPPHFSTLPSLISLGCIFWFLFYTLAGCFLFTLFEIVFPPMPQCGFLTDTEAPAWLPQRANSNLDLAQQYCCQEGGIKTKKQNKIPREQKRKKSVLILTQKEKLICSVLSRASFKDRVHRKRMWTPSSRHKSEKNKTKQTTTNTNIAHSLRNIFFSCQIHKFSLEKKKNCLSCSLDFRFKHVIFISLFCFYYFFFFTHCL